MLLKLSYPESWHCMCKSVIICSLLVLSENSCLKSEFYVDNILVNLLMCEKYARELSPGLVLALVLKDFPALVMENDSFSCSQVRQETTVLL